MESQSKPNPFSGTVVSDEDTSQMLRAQQAFDHAVRMDNLTVSRLFLVLFWLSFYAATWLAIVGLVGWWAAPLWLVLALVYSLFHASISRVLP